MTLSRKARNLSGDAGILAERTRICSRVRWLQGWGHGILAGESANDMVAT
jgi:hypothetical protein